jgi:hypothetical protein
VPLLPGDIGPEAGFVRARWVVLGVILSIILVVVLVVGIFWVWAVVTGGRYM